MKTYFNQLFSDLMQLKTTKPKVFWVMFIILVLVIFCGTSTVLMTISSANQPDNTVAMPTIFPTSADASRLMANTPALTPSLTPYPTATPLPSNLWLVNKHLEPINGSLVVEFVNLTTGETKKGLCQSPRDPEPLVGDIYIAELKGDYILLSPVIPGTDQVDLESKTQRFIFIASK